MGPEWPSKISVFLLKLFMFFFTHSAGICYHAICGTKNLSTKRRLSIPMFSQRLSLRLLWYAYSWESLYRPLLVKNQFFWGIIFFRFVFFYISKSLLLCFSASLLFCFLLFCFLLFCFSPLVCFYSSLLLCFSTFLLLCFCASSLLCFSTVLPLCFSAFLLFPPFLLFPASHAFLLFQLLCLPAFLLLCFSLFFVR